MQDIDWEFSILIYLENPDEEKPIYARWTIGIVDVEKLEKSDFFLHNPEMEHPGAEYLVVVHDIKNKWMTDKESNDMRPENIGDLVYHTPSHNFHWAALYVEWFTHWLTTNINILCDSAQYNHNWIFDGRPLIEAHPTGYWMGYFQMHQN